MSGVPAILDVASILSLEFVGSLTNKFGNLVRLHICSLRLETLNSKSIDSKSSLSPAFESIASFLSRFTNLKHSIELKPQLGSISALISDLEKLIVENSYFLPSYKVHSSLKEISDLKQSLEDFSLELVPKKKFSFKNKVAKKDPDTNSKMEEVKSKEAEKMGFAIPDSLGFQNKTGKVLVRKFEGSEVGEFTISDLDSCKVRIYGGPIMGSILIDGVEGCVFLPWSPLPAIS
ncbi:hypothetical protein UlMin_022812 [Ulmus minor]